RGWVLAPDAARNNHREVSGWRGPNMAPAQPPDYRTRRVGARGTGDKTGTKIAAALKSLKFSLECANGCKLSFKTAATYAAPARKVGGAGRGYTARGRRPCPDRAHALLGSGTTVIAAERIGRRCCGLEHDRTRVDTSICGGGR